MPMDSVTEENVEKCGWETTFLWYACFCGEGCRGGGFPGNLEGPVGVA